MGSESSAPLFSQGEDQHSPRSLLPWLVAGTLILLVLGAILLTSHKKAASTGAVLGLDPYAKNLSFSGIQMSESASLSGAKVTYIDGQVRNMGPLTVTAAELQVLFANDEQQPSQVESVPLTLIRTHEPYIDTEAVSAAPLEPGAEHEFRLAFEEIAPSWNQRIPEIHLTSIATR